MIKILRLLALMLGASNLSLPAKAQGFDPRPALGALISAFQNCGPPATYQMLSPELLNIVAQQTGNTGCYMAIRAAGPVTNMQVIDQKMFPAGPLYVIRVYHQGTIVDWFMGINTAMNKVAYLTFQAPQNGQPAPTVSGGPTAPSGGSPPPPPSPSPTSDGCSLYPDMC